MSLYNDYLQQSEKAKFNAQQATLSGDKRLQDFYNSSADQLFIRAMNLKMEEDERRMLEQQNQMQEQQKRFEEQQREMRVQQYINQQHSIEGISDREVDEDGNVILLPSEIEEYERFKRIKALREENEKLERELEELREENIKRRENMTFFQKAKEGIKGSILRVKLSLGLY